MGSDLTPPPMSDEAIADMAKQIGWASTEDGLHADVLALVARALAARDEQWRQRLEQVAWTLQSELDAKETTCRAHLWFSDPQNSSWTPLYRIKEQG